MILGAQKPGGPPPPNLPHIGCGSQNFGLKSLLTSRGYMWRVNPFRGQTTLVSCAFWRTSTFFFLHGYTANGGCRVRSRVRLYFCSRSVRGTIFGSEKLFRIFSPKIKFWTISTLFLAHNPKKRVFSSSEAFTRGFRLKCPLHGLTHGIGYTWL